MKLQNCMRIDMYVFSPLERKEKNGREWDETNEKKLRYRTKRFPAKIENESAMTSRQSSTRDDLVVKKYEWEFTNNHRPCAL